MVVAHKLLSCQLSIPIIWWWYIQKWPIYDIKGRSHSNWSYFAGMKILLPDSKVSQWAVFPMLLNLCILGGTTTSLYSIKCVDWPEIPENSVFMIDFCKYKNLHTDKIRPILRKFRNLSNFSMTYNFSPV